MRIFKGRTKLYIVYLLAVAVLLVELSISRYSTTGTLGGTVAVARPVVKYVPVSATLNEVPINISDGIDIENARPGDVLSYIFKITNFDDPFMNQVLMKYHINVDIIANPGGSSLPLECHLYPGGEYESDGDGWIYIGFSEETTHTYELEVSWDEGHAGPEYIDVEQTLSIKIIAEQALGTSESGE